MEDSFKGKLQTAQELINKKEEQESLSDGEDEHLYHISNELKDKNDFSFPLTEKVAEEIWQQRRESHLSLQGGYAYRDSVSFSIGNTSYSVVGFAGTQGSKHDYLFDLLVVQEDSKIEDLCHPNDTKGNVED